LRFFVTFNLPVFVRAGAFLRVRSDANAKKRSKHHVSALLLPKQAGLPNLFRSDADNWPQQNPSQRQQQRDEQATHTCKR
jgi:hypothetical protein